MICRRWHSAFDASSVLAALQPPKLKATRPLVLRVLDKLVELSTQKFDGRFYDMMRAIDASHDGVLKRHEILTALKGEGMEIEPDGMDEVLDCACANSMCWGKSLDSIGNGSVRPGRKRQD